MASCHEMKKGDTYSCGTCGVELKVTKTCTSNKSAHQSCGCDDMEMACCGEPMERMQSRSTARGRSSSNSRTRSSSASRSKTAARPRAVASRGSSRSVTRKSTGRSGKTRTASRTRSRTATKAKSSSRGW